MTDLIIGRVDAESLNDDFGREKHARVIAKFLLSHDKKELPLACGIFAPWGAGKTTFMRLMEKSIPSISSDSKVIWFEPWRYESSQDLAAALLLKVVSEIQESGKSDDIKDAAKKVGLGVAKSLGRIAVRTADSFIGIPILEGGLEEFRQSAEEQQLGHQPLIDQTLKEFRCVVQRWAGDVPLIVFIDDLDRCLPDHMVRLLEGLHLYLSGIQCVTIVGLDRSAIEAAISQRYRNQIENVGTHYIDKIFHSSFSLLRPSASAIAARYQSTLRDLGVSGNRLNPVDLACASNPRNYERFINQYVISRIVAESQIGTLKKDHNDLLIILTALRVAFPQFMIDATICGPISLQLLMTAISNDDDPDDLAKKLDGSGGALLHKYSAGDHPVVSYVRGLDSWAIQKLRRNKNKLTELLSMTGDESE